MNQPAVKNTLARRNSECSIEVNVKLPEHYNAVFPRLNVEDGAQLPRLSKRFDLMPTMLNDHQFPR